MTGLRTTPKLLAHRFASDRHGGTAVEMAVVLPFLTLMILGTIETGWMLWSTSTLDYAVEEAARCGAVDVNNCGTVAATQSVAASKAMTLGMAAANFTVTTPACGKQVAANYTFSFAQPFFTNFTVTIPATSCYPLPPPSP